MYCFSILLILIVILLPTGVGAQAPALPPPPPVAEYSPANWKELRSVEGGFAVSMPGVLAISSEQVDTNLGRIVMHLYVVETKLGEYGVSYSDLPFRVDNAADIKQVLDGARDEILANGAKLLSENDVTIEGALGRETIIQKAGIIGRHWMFFVEGRMYALILATTPTVAFKTGRPSTNQSDRTDLYEKTCSRFFGSFKFIKRNPTLPAEETRAGNNGVLEPVTAKTDLYRTDADAKKEIAEALTHALAEKKRVMLIFGGNWCYDCHVLDRALHEGDAGKIVKESFLLVHVDIGEGEKNPDLLKLYKIPLAKGVPAVAILTGQGKLIYSSGEGEFESARRMMKKDLVAFLLRWKKD